MDKEIVSLLKASLDKAEDKLETAEMLLKTKKYADAVSRAYYAAFHAAKAVLLTEGLSTNTHHGLMNLFGLHFVKTGKVGKKFGKYLNNLKDDRENSDYDIFSVIDAKVAEAAIKEAKEFVAEMQRYLKVFTK